MTTLLSLARPELLELEPYRAAAWEPALERLHANENPWRSGGDNSFAGLNRYPEPYPSQLVAKLAALYGVDPARLIAGRGSDEAIDLLMRAFCRAGVDSILVLPPTFGMYATAARIQGAKVLSLPLDAKRGFAPDPAAVVAACEPDTKLVFLCAPNNPTGNDIDPEVISSIAHALEGRALTIVDEAYVEFAGRPSFTGLQSKHANLVVLRTLSKAHALAGARCGSLIADPAIIGLVRRIIPPYSMSSGTLEAIDQALQPAQLALARDRIARLVSERQRLASGLARLKGVRQVAPSATNFLLVAFSDAQRAFERLLSVGLLVRDVRRQPGLGDSLRITIGLPEQNDRLLNALEGA